MDLLATARQYADAGLCVIPIAAGTKKYPRVKWTPFQQRKPTLAELERWFGGKREVNIACVLGPVSGGLACLDFDKPGSYEHWQASNPELASSLPAVQSSRGRHVYFRNPELPTKTIGGVELKAIGSYAMLPPSVHPSGQRYQWLKPLPARVEQVPLIDKTQLLDSLGLSSEVLDLLGFDESQLLDSLGLPMLHKRYIRGTQESYISGKEVGVVGSAISQPLHAPNCLELLPPAEVQALLDSTLPLQQGNRHHQVFQLARRLKGDSRLAGLPVSSFRELVRRWHKEGVRREVIRTPHFEASWLDFADAWERVRIPAGENVMATVLERVDTEPLPAAAERYGHPQVRRLVAVCWQLQRHATEHGQRGFYLSVRKAAELLDCDAMTASRWLRLLVLDNVLVVLAKGSIGGRRATLYRYVAE